MIYYTIWGKYKEKEKELLDTIIGKREMQRLLIGYRIALGPGWKVWYTIKKSKER